MGNLFDPYRVGDMFVYDHRFHRRLFMFDPFRVDGNVGCYLSTGFTGSEHFGVCVNFPGKSYRNLSGKGKRLVRPLQGRGISVAIIHRFHRWLLMLIPYGDLPGYHSCLVVAFGWIGRNDQTTEK